LNNDKINKINKKIKNKLKMGYNDN